MGVKRVGIFLQDAKCFINLPKIDFVHGIDLDSGKVEEDSLIIVAGHVQLKLFLPLTSLPSFGKHFLLNPITPRTLLLVNISD